MSAEATLQVYAPKPFLFVFYSCDLLTMNASEEFLGQRDDDARRTSDVAELVFVLVLDRLADELGAVGSSQFWRWQRATKRRWNRPHSRRFAFAEPCQCVRKVPPPAR